MTIKVFILRFIGVAALTFAGGLLFAATFHMMIMAGLTPDPDIAADFGRAITLRTAFVTMAAIVAGFIGIFMQGGLRWAFYLCPLYAPPLFAFAYTLLRT